MILRSDGQQCVAAKAEERSLSASRAPRFARPTGWRAGVVGRQRRPRDFARDDKPYVARVREAERTPREARPKPHRRSATELRGGGLGGGEGRRGSAR